ncbi:MAG: hypothetical protein DMG33_14520 [Acidobacteria bacterium]|nr:MAG: hypothetical protein DMG33_14520 [Acidobacteriota bacterium]
MPSSPISAKKSSLRSKSASALNSAPGDRRGTIYRALRLRRPVPCVIFFCVTAKRSTAKPSPGAIMSAPVKVQIFGQTYSIRGELEERYVQRLAAYVDEKMHAIAEATSTVDTQKAAVLAALAIADELHTLRREKNDHEELLREQAERCLTLVERALKQTA